MKLNLLSRLLTAEAERRKQKTEVELNAVVEEVDCSAVKGRLNQYKARRYRVPTQYRGRIWKATEREALKRQFNVKQKEQATEYRCHHARNITPSGEKLLSQGQRRGNAVGQNTPKTIVGEYNKTKPRQ